MGQHHDLILTTHATYFKFAAVLCDEKPKYDELSLQIATLGEVIFFCDESYQVEGYWITCWAT